MTKEQKSEVIEALSKQIVEAKSLYLTDIAGLSATDSHFIVGDGNNFVLENASTARTSLRLNVVVDWGLEVKVVTGLIVRKSSKRLLASSNGNITILQFSSDAAEKAFFTTSFNLVDLPVAIMRSFGIFYLLVKK